MNLRHRIVIVLSLFTACGLFEPRTITEVPKVETEAVDPFGLTVLLDGTGEAFAKFSWQDFFHRDLKYSNVNFTSTLYGKSILINHLLQQRELYPAAIVSWKKTQEFFRDATTITLNDVNYTIADSSAPDVVLFSGSSDFKIVREASSVWQIITWKDLSTSSFFFPEK